MGKKVNLAIQVLPKSKHLETYDLVDVAIDTIHRSGIKYRVCPFETVLEGTYEYVMQVVADVRTACFEAGADELLINMKLQEHREQDVSIEDKTGKYD